ncbi:MULTISPECIES: aspartyl/asparaginyl beta-hydroxylase domain-containing protein [unclassified Azospirillum]|uniref:aspartyl/asparaginyl beta-hydroxylase domain-containing protein n=1 Tax=unclassified Azospirillum TaxID=2630922 RepID=UPI000B70770A|nr:MULTISPECIES: aspartyl/asparaginyl beta-hydroxylase domain-containing protein [unclassified Azospirillum]SNR87124.1 Aspartyl/asparaginyl beta-hydroxylase, cupin superfamily [Azospirillum sp. RU38E]SNS03356.1 Aspartyl/asparaginyl beta-hydroxylase, cupin superfamily [Azospirillum sp. RU37A]
MSIGGNAASLGRAGMEAFRRGDWPAAQAAFQGAIAAGLDDAGIWLALAHAQRGTQDLDGLAVSLEKVLARDPRNCRALLLKGDLFAARGNDRSAVAFYREALKLAPPAAQTPADLAAELWRAQDRCQDYAQKFESFLQERLGAAGFDPARSSGRFARSLDILFGRRTVYMQQPQAYLFPELPHIQFYEREQFPWMEELEAATDAIRAELLAIMQGPEPFQPYLQSGSGDQPEIDQSGLRDSQDWSAFYLWKHGEPQADNIARCPATAAALAGLPLPRIRGRSPSILFSRLKPGARIPPHTGFVNTRLICHLPLIVPPGCGFRVGNETREWREGQAWLFDDTIEHEAWNNSDQTRVILLFDVWRPELTAQERDQVATMLAAIDDYGAGTGDWGN